MSSDKHAFLANEVARLQNDYADEFDRPQAGGAVTHQAVHQWAKSSGLARRGSRPAYSSAAAASLGGPEDIPAATAQLAADRGESAADTETQLVALAAGQTDEASMAGAIATMNAMPRNETRWLLVLPQTDPDYTEFSVIDHAVTELAVQRSETFERCYEQVRALTGGERTALAVRTAILDLAAMRPSGTVSLSVLSMDERRKDSAHTIPGTTDFPVPDVAHRRAAIARFKEGKLAGHSSAEVRSHIMKAAKRLGVQIDLGGGDGGKAKGKVAARAGTVALTGQPALSDRTRMTLYKMGMTAGPGAASDNLVRLSGLGSN